MAETQLTHKGLIWIARKTEQDGDNFTGSTPEVAIRKLWAEYPELDESKIEYLRPTTQARAQAIVDLDHCPVCGKKVEFARAMKPNGWIGVVAFHEDDEIPAEAERGIEVLKEYKKEILRKMHKSQPVQPAESESKAIVPDTPQPLTLISNMTAAPAVPKPKVVIEAKTKEEKSMTQEVSEPSETSSVPEVPEVISVPQTPLPQVPVVPVASSSLPVADISGLNHNRFAIVGKITSVLRKNGWTEDRIKYARSDLITNGKDLQTITQVASQYVQMLEDGKLVTA